MHFCSVDLAIGKNTEALVDLNCKHPYFRHRMTAKPLADERAVPRSPGRRPWSWFRKPEFGQMGRTRVIMFHGIGGGLFPTNAFEKLLVHLQRRFEVLHIGEALLRIGSEQPRTRPSVVLTFDDGLRNHAEVVYPLLSKYGLPAVFYVCPGLIEARQWLWPHEVRQRLLTMPIADRVAWASEAGICVSDPNGIVEAMKGLPNCTRLDLLASVRRVTQGFQPSEQQQRQFDVMSWNQLLSLDPQLVTVGSHTLTHPIMTSLPFEELEREFKESRLWLERRLQRSVEHFCYPNGSENLRVRTCAAKHYRSAVTTEMGYWYASTDALGIPRIDGDPRRLKMTWNLHRNYPNR